MKVFSTTLVNRTSVPASPTRSSLILRKALVTAGFAGALTVGAVAFPGTASAQEPPSHTSLAASATQTFPTWCPFGTHHGKGSGCRGGSLTRGDSPDKNTPTKDIKTEVGPARGGNKQPWKYYKDKSGRVIFGFPILTDEQQGEDAHKKLDAAELGKQFLDAVKNGAKAAP